MPKLALAEHRPWLLASLATAILFYVLSGSKVPELYVAALKLFPVGLLAVYALARHGSADARLLALVMALSAVGDMTLEFFTTAGGAFFFASHLAAISLYLRNHRDVLTGSQKSAGVALLIGTPVSGWLFTNEASTAVYALALGGMACAAWLSRFPRYRVGVGAVLFVASDILIFARLGGQVEIIANWLVWPLYYGGQFLIATGVIQTLRRRA
ncbi:lysoplasmalogenase family protein [Altererythrobacter sp. CAU 1778]